MFSEGVRASRKCHQIHEALNVLAGHGRRSADLVGGSGEMDAAPRRQRADTCNLFGDVESIRHKISVLEKHCADVGRDPSEITKTRLGSLVIGATDADARPSFPEFAAGRSMDVEQARPLPTVDGPDSRGRAGQAFLDAGLDGLLFSMMDRTSSESVRTRRPRACTPRRMIVPACLVSKVYSLDSALDVPRVGSIDDNEGLLGALDG